MQDNSSFQRRKKEERRRIFLKQNPVIRSIFDLFLQDIILNFNLFTLSYLIFSELESKVYTNLVTCSNVSDMLFQITI